MIRKTMVLSLFAMMALVLAACGGNTEGGNNGGDASSSSAPTIELAQSLTSTDAAGTGVIVSASVPEGWASMTEGQIVASTKQELLAGGPAAQAESGDMLLLVTALPAEMAGIMVPDGDASPAALLNIFSEQILSSVEGSEINEVEDVTIASMSVSRVSASAETGDFTLYAFEKDGAYVIMVTGSAAGEMGEHTATFEAILGTVAVELASVE